MAAGRFVVYRSKIIGGLVSPGVSIGVVVPLEESASLTATLTAADATALQLLRQITVAAAEKKWLQFQRIRLLVLRVRLRGTRLPPSIESA